MKNLSTWISRHLKINVMHQIERIKYISDDRFLTCVKQSSYVSVCKMSTFFAIFFLFCFFKTVLININTNDNSILEQFSWNLSPFINNNLHSITHKCVYFRLSSKVNFSFKINDTKIWRCPWCNGYRRRKWTRRHEFKSWTRLIAFHIALIPSGKVWIQLFSLQLWVNIRTDWVLQLWWDN